MSLTTAFKILFGLLPAIREGILVMEEILPGEGKGEKKLIMLREFIEDAMKIRGDSAMMTVLWPIIELWVARIVRRFNEDGWPKDEAGSDPNPQ